MEVWEMMCGNVNDFSVLVFANDEDAWAGIFTPDGKPKQWAKRPSVQPFVEKRRKKQKPQADIGYFHPGTFMLNEKARTALADFLLQFGELVEVDCEDEVKYYYNVTNLVSCVDYEGSAKLGTAVTKAVFLADAIPTDAQIFKDPLTVSTRTYLTSAAKAILEQRIADAQLTGLKIFEAGTR
jgi:hypothetical protein